MDTQKDESPWLLQPVKPGTHSSISLSYVCFSAMGKPYTVRQRDGAAGKDQTGLRDWLCVPIKHPRTERGRARSYACSVDGSESLVETMIREHHNCCKQGSLDNLSIPALPTVSLLKGRESPPKGWTDCMLSLSAEDTDKAVGVLMVATRADTSLSLP